ncbi:MAG: sensor histidine kinase [Rhodospirillaceae bacterium]
MTDTSVTSAQKLPVLSHSFPQLGKTLSLRTQLLILVIGTILPLSVLSVINVVQDYRASQKAAAEEVLRITRGGIATVDRELEYVRAGLEVLALSPSLRAQSFDAFREEALHFIERFPDSTTVALADRDGQQWMNTRVAPGDRLGKRSAMATVNKVFATRKPVVSDIHVGAVTGVPVFTVEVPVFRDGAVVYDLSFSTSRARFVDYLQQISLPDGWVATILDTQGQHVARRPAPVARGITHGSPTLIAALATGDEVITQTTSLEGAPLLTAFSRSPETGWTFALGMPTDSMRGAALRSLALAGGVSVLLLAVGISFASRLGRQLIRADANRELLINELNHRVKNTLSSVLGIVSRSLRGASDLAGAQRAIEARIMALARAHDILTNQNWGHADLWDIAGAILGPHADTMTARLQMEGPAVRLEPRKAIPLALVLSELTTNAVKYGALSVPRGGVRVKWTVEKDRLLLEWTETGGPEAVAPAKPGYGMRFIERAVTGELGGKLEMLFQPSGLCCLIEIPLGKSAA